MKEWLPVLHTCGCRLEYLIELHQGTPEGARRWLEARPCPRCAKKEAKCLQRLTGERSVSCGRGGHN